MKDTVGKIEYHVVAKKRFELGQTVTTPGALVGIPMAEILQGLMRHSQGDWGDIGPEDRQENELALVEGFRLFSVYQSANGRKFWIITEADRSVTTVLLPEEY